MKQIFLILGICLLFTSVRSQILKTGKDTAFLMDNIAFPSASANMVFVFSEKMLNLYELPQKNKSAETLEQILIKLEKDKKNVGLYIDAYFASKAKNEHDNALPYLQKAYGIAMELYELNPSNIELIEQLSTMMIEVNRISDVPALWKDYTVRNPQVARGWAKLATFQSQILDTIGCRYSMDRAFELNPEEPQLYVAALSQVFASIILNMQKSPNQSVKADLTFLKKVLSQRPDSEMLRTIYITAELIELFYGVMLKNVEKFQENKAFVLTLDERQKISLTELEKTYKGLLANPKIINKYILLKSLLVIEILKGKPEMGQAYLEESKKYIEPTAQIYKFLSFGYLPSRNFSEAIPLLKKATDISAAYDDLFALARLYFENKELDKSNEILEKMLSVYPGKIDVALGIISNLFKQGKFEDACNTLFRIETIYEESDPENTDGFYIFFKAVCTLVFSKNKEEVKKALERVIELDLAWTKEAKMLFEKFFQ